MKIKAFTESRERTWTHTLSIRDSTYTPGGKVLSINPPNIGYNLDDYFLSLFEFPRDDKFCVDAGGRNYGVNESVYISTDDITTYLKQEGFIETNA